MSTLSVGHWNSGLSIGRLRRCVGVIVHRLLQLTQTDALQLPLSDKVIPNLLVRWQKEQVNNRGPTIDVHARPVDAIFALNARFRVEVVADVYNHWAGRKSETHTGRSR